MDTALIAARGLHFAAQIALGGTFAFVVLVARPASCAAGGAVSATLQRPLRLVAATSLVLALIVSLPWLALVARDMSGEAVGKLLSSGALRTVLTETRFGHVFLLRLVLMLSLAPFVGSIGGEALRDRIALILAAALLGATAWEGHAGAEEGIDGAIHLAADASHFIAAGFWLGGLLPLALLLIEAERDTSRRGAIMARDAAARFSAAF